MFKKWVVNLLGGNLGLYFFFVNTTIESIGNKIYDTILIVWTVLALLSVYLLKKYSKFFD